MTGSHRENDLAEIRRLDGELAKLRPVLAAAIRWSHYYKPCVDIGPDCPCEDCKLWYAVREATS